MTQNHVPRGVGVRLPPWAPQRNRPPLAVFFVPRGGRETSRGGLTKRSEDGHYQAVGRSVEKKCGCTATSSITRNAKHNRAELSHTAKASLLVKCHSLTRSKNELPNSPSSSHHSACSWPPSSPRSRKRSPTPIAEQTAPSEWARKPSTPWPWA